MKTIAALVFPGFETLDYFGPIEMLGGFGKETEIVTVAKGHDPTPSVHGQRIVIDKSTAEKNDYDLLFIPGGDSALKLAGDEEMMQWIRDASANAERVMAVCTGYSVAGHDRRSGWAKGDDQQTGLHRNSPTCAKCRLGQRGAMGRGR